MVFQATYANVRKKLEISAPYASGRRCAKVKVVYTPIPPHPDVFMSNLNGRNGDRNIPTKEANERRTIIRTLGRLDAS